MMTSPRYNDANKNNLGATKYRHFTEQTRAFRPWPRVLTDQAFHQTRGARVRQGRSNVRGQLASTQRNRSPRAKYHALQAPCV
jgi:hypothetical protein